MSSLRRNTHRDRVLNALARYRREKHRPGDPLPGRAEEVFRLLKEILRGDGIELPPEKWRDRVLILAERAIERGADSNEVHRIAERFLERTDCRFDALERGTWRWAFGHQRRPPPYTLGTHDDLADTALELWRLTPEGRAR